MSFGHIAAGVLLLMNTVIDIWKKRISILSIVLFILIWLLWGTKDRSWIDVVTGFLPGIGMAAVSLVTRGGLGLGDGLLVLALGLYLSWIELLVMIMSAFFLAFLWAVLQFSVIRNGAKIFPFVPFMLLGYGIVLWI